MADHDEELKAIEEKADKGEDLTKDEEAKLLGAPESEDEEEIDPEKKIIKADDEEAAEEVDPENPSESAKTAEAKKQQEADDAAKQAERKKLIEAEAEKPIDQAKIEDYSPSERALFFELKKERRKRQDAQAEADTLKFQRAKEEERKRIEREKAELEEEEDPFDGKDEDDILTVADVKKLIARNKAKASKPAEKLEDIPDEVQKRANLMQERLWLYEAKDEHPDVGEITAYADDLLRGDKEAEAEVADVVRRGGNAVLAIYNLIKTHPNFPEIEAKIKAKAGKPAEAAPAKKEEKPSAEETAKTNKERAERIEKNKEKPKTTGAGGGSAAVTGEYTIQELLDMPEKEFARLPKDKRDRILQQL